MVCSYRTVCLKILISDVQGKLDIAEHRCDLLERQLNYMRQLVTTAETDRGKALQKITTMEDHHDDHDKKQLDKLSHLERQHLQLTASQTVTQVIFHSNNYLVL